MNQVLLALKRQSGVNMSSTLPVRKGIGKRIKNAKFRRLPWCWRTISKKTKRHTPIIRGISRNGIKRILRKHGIQRSTQEAQQEIRKFARITVEVLIQDAKIYTHAAHRRTIMVQDIIAALRKHNIVHYGHVYKNAIEPQ